MFDSNHGDGMKNHIDMPIVFQRTRSSRLFVIFLEGNVRGGNVWKQELY